MTPQPSEVARAARGKRSILSRVLNVVAAAAMATYLAWWAYWLWQGSLAPSIFLELTGLPCPTTGCTRSMISLWQGRWGDSLRFNPMTLPIAGLFVASVVRLAWGWIRHRKLLLPGYFLFAWLGVLALAWAIKLLGHFGYW